MGGGVDRERCIPIPQWMGIRPEAIGTRRTDIPMVVGVQQIEDRSLAACIRYSGDDLDIKAIHLSQQKMTKKQQIGNRPMATGTRRENFSPRDKTNRYLKQVQQMGKRLITTSTQRIAFGRMVVLQQTTVSRIVAE